MDVKVVKESKLGLNWLGKTVTLANKELGEGIVVGYSSITGEPLAYFYSGYFGDKICSFSHKKVISVVDSLGKLRKQDKKARTMKDKIVIRVDQKELDEALEKANRLKKLLEEIQILTHSLFTSNQKDD